ncbi:MAG: phage protein Gp27 family protein [Patescibacteria group bacterium]
MARRTHSTIDTLPQSIRDTLMQMVVDGQWPGSMISHEGKPTYDDIVAYCSTKGFDISRSAIGRWAKGLLAFERMRTAAGIARKVMGDLTAETATETQKAAAEIMTAQIIELISDNDLKPKDISMISGAIRDCTQVALKADQYIRTQIADRAKAAAASAGKKLKDAGMDRKKVQEIIDDILGITKS